MGGSFRHGWLSGYGGGPGEWQLAPMVRSLPEALTTPVGLGKRLVHQGGKGETMPRQLVSLPAFRHLVFLLSCLRLGR
jgi:hypothetical protein